MYYIPWIDPYDKEEVHSIYNYIPKLSEGEAKTEETSENQDDSRGVVPEK